MEQDMLKLYNQHEALQKVVIQETKKWGISESVFWSRCLAPHVDAFESDGYPRGPKKVMSVTAYERLRLERLQLDNKSVSLVRSNEFSHSYYPWSPVMAKAPIGLAPLSPETKAPMRLAKAATGVALLSTEIKAPVRLAKASERAVLPGYTRVECHSRLLSDTIVLYVDRLDDDDFQRLLNVKPKDAWALYSQACYHLGNAGSFVLLYRHCVCSHVKESEMLKAIGIKVIQLTDTRLSTPSALELAPHYMMLDNIHNTACGTTLVELIKRLCNNKAIAQYIAERKMLHPCKTGCLL